MWAAILPVLTTLAVWAGRIGMVLFAYDQYKNLTAKDKETINTGLKEANAAGMTQDDAKQIVAATTYDTIEKQGKSPDDFWAGLTQEEKDALQFSPESLRRSMDRTKFLGFGSAFLFVAAAFAAGLAAKRGIPIGLKTIAKIAEARKAGASALELMTIFEEGKILGLAKVWVPAATAGLLTIGGYYASGLTNNMNDVDLWGRVFLGQAADDFTKAQKQKTTGSGGSGDGLTTGQGPRTIIRMVEEKKPQQFLGTLFSAKLGKLEHFDRKLDDEITDMDDLETDVKLNVNKWLQTLPGRMGYSIVIRKDPVDETGVQQSGIWATATLHILQLSGKILPIDTILLGPVSPQVRLELARSTKTIETQIDGIVSAQEIHEIDIPNGVVDIFTPSGERVFQSGNAAAPVETKATPIKDDNTVPVSKAGYDFAATYAPNNSVVRIDDVEFVKRDGEMYRQSDNKKAVVETPKAVQTQSSGTLRNGSSGSAVRTLQTKLNNLGENLTVDGVFGAKTEAAVKRFQSSYGLTVDGIVGEKTQTKLSAISFGAGSASLIG